MILTYNFLFVFFGKIFVLFWYQRVMVASQDESESVSSSAIFWKSFRRIGVNSFLNVV